MTQSTPAPTERVKTSYGTWAVVGGGLLLTAAMAFLAWRAEALDRKAQIDRRVASFRAVFQEKRNGIEDLLLNLRALFNQTPNLSRESFRAAVEGLSIRMEGVQALGWAPVVHPEDRPRLLEQARTAQLSQFEFRQGDTAGGVKPASSEATLASVLFVDPAAGNEHLLGLDLYSADLGHILQEAARTGTIMLSPKVQVRLQDQVAGGFIVAIAVYHPTMKPAEEKDRLGQLKGFVFALIAAQDMLGRLAGRVPDFNLDVMIIDSTAPPAQRLVCLHTQRPAAEAEALKSEARFREDLVTEFPVEISGFGWHFLFRKGPGWSDGRGIWFVPAVAGCGLLLTLLLRQRVKSAHRWTREVQHLVVQRTAELTNANTRLETEIRERQEAETALARERNILRNLVDRLPDAIAVTDMTGRVVTINAAQTRLPAAAAAPPRFPAPSPAWATPRSPRPWKIPSAKRSPPANRS